ncbi:uncharacterized protein KD926_003673 [Aspergillus affinis]|uniref:uncharacterized protein n=1 Tax=Aspergillus affinis TaxID=1070780 RepID=UPI0022FE8931|nr:uncharacterized protein KD926_003673 [Aspergillus affinis]KAI9035398.1 hypothetical protein KD926_003673 [Aspergillus affinis]
MKYRNDYQTLDYYGGDPEADNWDPPVEPPGHDQLPIKHHATGFIIKPVEHAKYLGIWLDRTLSFDTHRVKALAKANRTLEALRSISGSTLGTSLLSMRRIYLAVVVPQLLYGAAAWYSPTSRTVTDDIDTNRIPMTKERFLEEIKKNPEVVYEVMRGMHELEIKRTNKARKDIIDLTAERNAIAVKWALSKDRTDTSGYRSTKIPDPPMLNTGENPSFENWQLAIHQKMAANADHYHTFASEFQYLAVEGRIDRNTWKESFFFAFPDEVQRMVAYAFSDDNRTFGDFTHECAKVADLWGNLKKRRNHNTVRGGSKSSSSTPNKGASSRLSYVKGKEKDQLIREVQKLPFLIVDLGQNDVILGRKWLQVYQVLPDCSRNRLLWPETITLREEIQARQSIILPKAISQRPKGLPEVDIFAISGSVYQLHLGKLDCFITSLAQIDKIINEKNYPERLLEVKLKEQIPESYHGFVDVFLKRRPAVLRRLPKLNSITKKNRYPLPLMDELLGRLGHAKIFTKLDIRQGFYRIRMYPDSVDLTTFRTKYGSYKYQLINNIFIDLIDKYVAVYVDDILIFSLQAAIHKCEFGVKRTKFLGFILTPDGIEVDPEKVAVITNWQVPTTVREVQSFLGFCNLYRRFIEAYSRIVRPLNMLGAERNYDIHDKELLAIVRTLGLWRTELEGLQTTERIEIWTDYRALEYFMTTKKLNGRQARPGLKNTAAEALSRPEESPLDLDTKNQALLRLEWLEEGVLPPQATEQELSAISVLLAPIELNDVQLMDRLLSQDQAEARQTARNLEQIWDYAKGQIELAQVKIKRQADKYRRPVDFKAEDLVYVTTKDWKLGRLSRKFGDQWAGPYEIIEQI